MAEKRYTTTGTPETAKMMLEEEKRRKKEMEEHNKRLEEAGMTVKKASGGSVCARPTGKGFGKARKR